MVLTRSSQPVIGFFNVYIQAGNIPRKKRSAQALPIYSYIPQLLHTKPLLRPIQNPPILRSVLLDA